MVLNPDKSEVLALGTAQHLESASITDLTKVAGSVMPVSTAVKIVGVTLDGKLTLDRRFSDICSACSYHTRALRHIRPLIDRKLANTLAGSKILSRLDY